MVSYWQSLPGAASPLRDAGCVEVRLPRRQDARCVGALTARASAARTGAGNAALRFVAAAGEGEVTSPLQDAGCVEALTAGNGAPRFVAGAGEGEAAQVKWCSIGNPCLALPRPYWPTAGRYQAVSVGEDAL